MLQIIDKSTLDGIQNPAFRSYALRYLEIEEMFRANVEATGISFAGGGDDADRSRTYACPRERAVALPEILAAHVGDGLTITNDGKSLYTTWQSPSCAACRLGLRTETFSISTRCPHRCFFCFNPNQENGDARPGDALKVLEQRGKGGVELDHIALTGGEPLLFPHETLEFITRARQLYSSSRIRLYTSGYDLDEGMMRALGTAGLDEIRFSIKTEAPEDEVRLTLCRIAEATGYVPDVMVEMPILPSEVDLMKGILLELDRAGVRGMNLLELGYSFSNAREFVRRALQIKSRPLRVLYNYLYAGGLPVHGSEEACLELMAFGLDEGLRMGLHYCSVENKFTGQVYQQNDPYRKSFTACSMSERDHFLKCGKVFGNDVAAAKRVLSSHELRLCRADEGMGYLALPVDLVPRLAAAMPNAEIGISYNIVEVRDGEPVLRELRVDATTPALFDPAEDV